MPDGAVWGAILGAILNECDIFTLFGKHMI
jgi:hypothetical protein